MDKKKIEKVNRNLETLIPTGKGLRGVPNKVKTKIVLTEKDVRCVIGKTIESVGRRFTATEVNMYAHTIGSEIIWNVIKRMDKSER